MERRGAEGDLLLPNLGCDDLLSLSVVSQKETQNPAK